MLPRHITNCGKKPTSTLRSVARHTFVCLGDNHARIVSQPLLYPAKRPSQLTTKRPSRLRAFSPNVSSPKTNRFPDCIAIPQDVPEHRPHRRMCRPLDGLNQVQPTVDRRAWIIDARP